MTTLNFVILLVVLVIIGGLVIKICFLNDKIFDYERSEAKLNGDIAKLENKLESAESKNKAYLKKEIEYELNLKDKIYFALNKTEQIRVLQKENEELKKKIENLEN